MIIPTNRRTFLRRSAAAALLAGLPKGWVGSAYASDAPETADVKLGIIALTDCSSIVVAHEKGLFKKRSEERRVGKEERQKRTPEPQEKKNKNGGTNS